MALMESKAKYLISFAVETIAYTASVSRGKLASTDFQLGLSLFPFIILKEIGAFEGITKAKNRKKHLSFRFLYISRGKGK
jgi:hypothetical protein